MPQLIQSPTEDNQILLQRFSTAINRYLELAGCSVKTTDVAGADMHGQQM